MPHSPSPKQEQLLGTIFAAAAKIASETDYTRLLSVIADLGKDLLGCDRCTLWMVDQRRKELWTKLAHGLEMVRIPLDSGIVGQSVASGQPLVINNPYEHPSFNAEVDQQSGYKTRSILVIPMFGFERNVIGAFQAINKLDEEEQPIPFDQNDVIYLKLASSLSSKILDTEYLNELHRYDRSEQEKAHQKQKSILRNDFHDDPRFHVEIAYLASDVLSGDSYSLYRTQDGGVLIYLVDAMGHGVLPSLTSFAVASTISQYILQVDSLEELAEKLMENLKVVLTAEEQLACGFLWFDPSFSQVDYCVSGIYPPLLQTDSDVIPLRPNIPPIMVFDDNIKVEMLRLEGFRKLLLYSDGLVEDLIHDVHYKKTAELLDRATFQNVMENAKKQELEDDLTVIYFEKLETSSNL